MSNPHYYIKLLGLPDALFAVHYLSAFCFLGVNFLIFSGTNSFTPYGSEVKHQRANLDTKSLAAHQLLVQFVR